jgi:osmotically-inducible protein OsmY
MSVVNLPGLWDQIGPSAMGFAENLQRAVAPNFYAKKKLEELIQKDPSVIDKFQNMDPTARAALAKGLGFSNGEDPFASLAPGMDLQKKQQEFGLYQQGIKQDPTGAAARAAGARTAEGQAIDAGNAAVAKLKPQIAQQEIQQNAINIDVSKIDKDLKGLALRKTQQAQARLEKWQAANPNFNLKDVFAAVQDPSLMTPQITEAYANMDEGQHQAIKDLLNVAGLNNQLAKAGIMADKSNRAQANMARENWIRNSAKDDQNAYNNAKKSFQAWVQANILGKVSLQDALKDPKFKAQYDQLHAELEAYRNNYNESGSKAAETMGTKFTPVPTLGEEEAITDSILKKLQGGN